MRLIYISLILLFCCSSIAQAQDTAFIDSSGQVYYRMPNVIDLDTMVFVEHYFADPDEMRRFKWTRYLVQRVYPLAMQALDIMAETDTTIARINKKRKRKKHLRKEYKSLTDIYKDDLKDMYVEEGRILIKIIERETNMRFYDIIRKYKSGTTAFFWNTVANLNGYSLKDGYDPEKEKYLEIILSEM
jgi:Domain of unknown function (DUF4294)